MKTYFEILLKKEIFYHQIRDECFKRFGSPLQINLVSDGENEWLRTTSEKEIEIAETITGESREIKRYREIKEPDNPRGFTWGT